MGGPLPSRTAILVAAARAFASRDPDEQVRNPDVLADLLIGPEELALIDPHPISKALAQDYAEAIQDPVPVFFCWGMLLRTRYIDEALLRALRNGIRQIVILGAGFDSRAYRFRDAMKDCKVIEVDAAPTQQYKQRRLREVGCQIPPNLTYCAVDFAKESLAEVLPAAGIDCRERTFYVWEGVCMYLTEENVRKTLRAVKDFSPSGSSLVLDYANQRWIGLAASQPRAGGELFRTWGEPWLFGVPDPDGVEFFRELGFDPGVPISVSNLEMLRRYTTRQDGTLYGSHALKQRQEQPRQDAAPRDVYWLAELLIS